MRTQSGLGNTDRNRKQQPYPQGIEQVPIVEVAPEPVRMAGVQAMMVEQREEMRQLFLNNRGEPTMPVEQPELNDR